jgi:hypothetical protein
MHVQQMISTHPQVRGQINDALIRCIESCFDCAQACTACADACLAEDGVKDLTQCIGYNLDCADVCLATGTIGSRRTGANAQILKTMIEACAEACRRCGEECERHAPRMEHCRICAEACRQCEAACQQAAGGITPRLQ